jgi:hypothetical protein
MNLPRTAYGGDVDVVWWLVVTSIRESSSIRDGHVSTDKLKKKNVSDGALPLLTLFALTTKPPRCPLIHTTILMRRLWTTVSLALVCAGGSLAHPHPQLSWQDLQQLPFSSLHRTMQLDDSNKIGTYARFDNEQVLRVEVSSRDQLEQLQAAVEVSPLSS